MTNNNSHKLYRWYRIWVFFLAYSVIASRQGSASVFQITLHKNLNAFHRIEGVPSHTSIHGMPARELSYVLSLFFLHNRTRPLTTTTKSHIYRPIV